MKSLLLVDGSSLLSKSFFGNTPPAYKFAKTEEDYEKALPKLLQKDGQYTNGVFQMMRTLLKIIKHQKNTHIVVAWDMGRSATFRRKLYPDYKGTRGETRPELKSQFPLAQRVLKEMGIAQFGYSEYEADDIIGTFSKKFKDELPVYILSGDQDSLQLVNERVRLWYMTSKAEAMYEEVGLDVKQFNIPDNTFEMTPLYVEHFYGLQPIQIIDKKAIEGDPSDNIPGIKGVGEKSVVPLLQEFGTVEGIYDFFEGATDAEIKDMMKALGVKKSPFKPMMEVSDEKLVGKEAVKMSKKLATIMLEIEELIDLSEDPKSEDDTEPVIRKVSEINVDDIRLQINEVGQRKVFEELSFKSLLEVTDTDLDETA